MSPFRRLIFLLLAGLLAPASFAAAPPTKPPNVVVITIDTLRPDHLGCYGYKQIRTPNIDALAASGIRFERAYTSVPVTLPSHTTIFTGTYPIYSGMHDFAANKLGATQPTLASVLKDHGYVTGAVVASAVLDSRFGLNRGFDFYYDHFDFSRLDESNIDEMERPGNVVADVTLDWLSKNYQKKFFLWMHLYDPHYPYRPPAPYNKEYKDHLYDGEIAFADAQVGRIIRFLKDKGIYQNTLIVLSGDHGESLGEHGEKTHGFFIYNSTLHVPLIFHMPGPAGYVSVSSDLVNLADLMPTVLNVLSIEVPPVVQGRSLVTVLSHSAKPELTKLYAETFLPRLHFNWSELRSVETAHYHFIDAPKPELYDLMKDPGETQNLYTQKKAVSEEMRAQLVGLIQKYGAGQELAQKTGLDPALMERLKSLGYAGFSGGGSDITITDRKLADPKDRVQTYELFSDGMADSQHGHYDEAAKKLNAVLKTDPDSVPAHYLLGLNYYRLNDFPHAIEHLNRALELSPTYALAAFNLGLAYAHTGDMDRAIDALRRTLELDPTNFVAAHNLGAAYLQKQMVPEAIAALRQSISASPDYELAHRSLGEVLLYQGQVDEALAELRRATELAPEDRKAHAVLAQALKAKGLDQQAEDEMRRAQ
jgi:arylsulfatase A-like enzyme/cytochrome c-type biogenesis protein CcmH/NrfG